MDLNIPIEKKIMLYIHSFGEVQDVEKVSHLLTQDTLSEVLNTPRGSISRSLKKLQEKNIVEEKLAHVKGKTRRIRAYVLTWDGYGQAEDMKNELRRTDLSYRNLDGDEISSTLGDILEKTKEVDPDLTILEALDIYLTEQVLDLRLLRDRVATNEAATTVKEPTAKVMEYAPPEIRYFYDREKELPVLADYLNDRPVIVLQGIAGIGKSTLAAKLLEQHRGQRPLFWHRVREMVSLGSILVQMASFLSGLGKHGLKTYLDSNAPSLDLSEVLDILLEDLKDTKAILLFDDFQRCDERTVRFFSSLKDCMDGQTLIILTRMHVPFYDRRDVSVRGVVGEMELQGLDPDGALSLLTNVKKITNLKESDLKEIYSLTGGHPLALELIEDVSEVGGHGDIMLFFQEEIFSALMPHERGLLEYLSVYREPVAPEAFLREEYSGYDSLERLQARSLIDTFKSNTFEVKGFIRNYVYQRIPPSSRKRYHHSAAQFYGQLKEDQAMFERVHHLLQAQEPNLAADLLVKKGKALLKQHAEEIMTILSTSHWDGVEPENYSPLQTLKGDILKMWGEWDNVLEYYYQSFVLFGYLNPKTTPTIGIVHGQAGYMNWSRDEMEKSLEDQRKSLEMLDEHDHISEAEVHRSMGWTQWLLAEFPKAKEAFQQSLECLEKEKDGTGPQRAKVLLNLGNISSETGEYQVSLDRYREALEVLKQHRDEQTRVRVLNNLGTVHLALDDPGKARECFVDGLKIAEDINFMKGQGYLLLHLASCFEGEKAQEYLEIALKTFDRIDDGLGIAYASSNLALYYLQNREKEKASTYLNESKGLIENLDLPYYLDLVNSLIDEQ
jgi:ATP/maltotriose-dependent transcriptional regulator MalT/DNA-binding MarR family transcriptional regulator